MSLDKIISWEAMAFVAALAVIVAYKMFTGGINVNGLLQMKDGSGRVSPERVQLLLFVITTSVTYLNSVFQSPTTKMPDLPMDWTFLAGGSSALYALGKFLRKGTTARS